MSRNELRDSASPYLLQHAQNPVHWRLWGAAALAEAQAQAQVLQAEAMLAFLDAQLEKEIEE